MYTTYEEPLKERQLTLEQMKEVYRDLVNKEEYPVFDYWLNDMLKSGVFEREQSAHEWTIECGSHTYVTLRYKSQVVKCYDNDCTYMEDIIASIEKRTKMRFCDIEIIGKKEDFNGLRFLNGGFRYDWL